MSFKDFGLDPEVVRGVESMGYVETAYHLYTFILHDPAAGAAEAMSNGEKITDPVDAQDLELLADKFLRRINMSMLGLVGTDTLP